MAVPSLFHQNLSERVKQNSRMRQLSPSNRSLSSCDSPLASDSVGGSPETVDYPVGDIPCRNFRRATKSHTKSLMRKYNFVKNQSLQSKLVKNQSLHSKLVVGKYKAIKQRRLSQKQQSMDDRFENRVHSSDSPIKVLPFAIPNCVEQEKTCDKKNDSITEQVHMHLTSMEKCAMETDEVTSTVFSDSEKSFSAVLFTDAHLSSAQECSPVKTMNYENTVPFTRNENLRLVINNSAADVEDMNSLADFDLLDMPVLSPILPSSPMTFNASEELPHMTSSFQDQFLQFVTSPEEKKSFALPVEEHDECPQLTEPYRRKRSRSNLDNSTCPCCFGANRVDKRKKTARGRRKSRSHRCGIPKLWRLNAQHQDYIDSSQRLMALRRKLFTLFCTIFPKLKHLLDDINPDTGKLDLVINEVIDIVQNNDDEDDLIPDEKMSVNNNSDGLNVTGDCLMTETISTPPIDINSDSSASDIESEATEPQSKPASPDDVNVDSCALEPPPVSADDDCISSTCLPPNSENSDTQLSRNANMDFTVNQSCPSNIGLTDSNDNLSLKCSSSETAVSNSTLKTKTCTDESAVTSSSDSLSIESRYKIVTDSVHEPSEHKANHGCDTSKELEIKSTVECGTQSPYDIPYSEAFSCTSKSEVDLMAMSCRSSPSHLFSNSAEDSCTANPASLAKFGLMDVKISLCNNPDKCLSLLRYKIGSLLHSLLPDLTFDNNFDANSDDVEHLLDSVIRCNTQTSLFSLNDILF